MKILVAITGASGTIYAQRLLDNLDPARHEVHIVLSNYAQVVISQELPGGLRIPQGVTTHSLKSMNAPFASGSNPPDAMVVIPCSMGTLGRIAHGYSEDVLLSSIDPSLLTKDDEGKQVIDERRFLAENLVYPAAHFDVVFAWNLPDYIDESLVKPVVGRLWSVLKPGGLLLAFFHTKDATDKCLH